VHAHRFGLFRVRSPLLAESLLVFSSSAYLDVSVQVSPFGHVRINRSFAPPRTFSQLTTSFVASRSQGIPHAPLFASYSCLKTALRRPASLFYHSSIKKLPIHLKTTPLLPFYLHFFLSSPSLVNELFDPFYPVSSAIHLLNAHNTPRRVQQQLIQVSNLASNLC
jgi:hypothetical protein